MRKEAVFVPERRSHVQATLFPESAAPGRDRSLIARIFGSRRRRRLRSSCKGRRLTKRSASSPRARRRTDLPHSLASTLWIGMDARFPSTLIASLSRDGRGVGVPPAAAFSERRERGSDEFLSGPVGLDGSQESRRHGRWSCR